MAKTGAEKTLFSANSSRIEFLGMALSRSSTGYWILDDFIQVRAETVAQQVEDVINTDKRAGQAGRISYVLVPPRVFNVLFLEGSISLDQLAAAEEDKDELSVTVKGVRFAGGLYTVKGMSEDTIKARHGTLATAMTIDAKGNIV
jgi:hypothetical protein